MRSEGNGLVGYFGFGSLVNRDTLTTDYIDVIPATLQGWRRHWQARTGPLAERVALLSVHQEPACDILGALVVDRLENLPSVDEREWGYTRHRLSVDDLIVPEDSWLPDDLFVYVANTVDSVADNGALIYSYLDAVLQGFHQLHGPEGVSHFIDTTVGFSRPLINDREEPIYSRSVSLKDEERMLFDRELSRSGAWLQQS